MSVRCEDYNQVSVMTLEADLCGDACSLLRRTAEERIGQRQIVDFVVDLERTTFIDSEGLESLLWLKRRCEDHYGSVKLAGLDANCTKILEVTRLDHRFECCRDMASALKAMR